MILKYKYINFYAEFDEPKDNYDIISCSIFRIINNYKNEHIYVDGLKLLLEKYEKSFPGFYLRVYYDNSVLDYETSNKIENTKKLYQPLFDELKQHPKVQLIRYEMPLFQLDKIHHKGLIGTIPRLYPLFDTVYNKNINTTIILDIDIKNYELDTTIQNYDKLQKAKLNFFYRTRFDYDLQPRFQVLSKYFNIKFPILAGTTISKIKFPLDILDNFFKCILDKNQLNCEYYKDFDKLTNLKYSSKINDYKYGIDEILTILIKEYLYKNKIKHLILFHNSITDILYDVFIKYKNKTIQPEMFKNTLQFLLRDEYNKNKSIDENYNIIDHIIYLPIQNISTNITKNILVNRILELIKKINNKEVNKNDFAFSKNDIIFLQKKEYMYYIIDYTNKFSKDNIQKIDF
jgi:hypothetical protein